MAQGTTKTVDVGLLVLRVGFGIMFIVHGYPKITGGPDVWEQLGGAMGTFGITFMPQAWGFMAAFAEFAGGILLVLGLLVRPASLFLFITMVVAAAMHLSQGHGLGKASHAIEAGIVFLALIIIGGGALSADAFFKKKGGVQ